MKNFHLTSTFLLIIGASFLLSPVSLAAVHHVRVQQQASHQTYFPGNAYYSFSSLVTAGSGAGTIGAANGEGGLTLHIAADGTFTGTVVANPSSVHRVNGSFQSDGSISLSILYSLGTIWHGTAHPRGHGKYVGTFVVSYAGIVLRSGIWVLVPVRNPQNVVSIDVSMLTTAEPDRNTLYGGVILLDSSGSYGTLRLQDGRVVPALAHISQDKISFAFLLNRHLFVFATGIPTIIGTVVKYTGTFVGPHRGDRGNWSGYSFTFAL